MDLVNGRSEQGIGGREEDQRPFIVVATSENDADPNEAFIPTADDNDTNRPGFKLLTQEDLQRHAVYYLLPDLLNLENYIFLHREEEREDFEVIEAGSVEDTGRTFIPTNDRPSGQAGFKLLSPEDLLREESQDDVIVVEAAADDGEPRLLDIPRDTSGKDQPFFKLPLPDEAEEDEYDDVVIIAASSDEEVS